MALQTRANSGKTGDVAIYGNPTEPDLLHRQLRALFHRDFIPFIHSAPEW